MVTRQKKRITVQDVADYCGLSKSTVAYVLRQPDTCKASLKTKEKVAEAVRKLGYRTNPAARALSTRRYHAIGVLLPHASGYYNELMIQLNKQMNKHNYFGVFSFWETDRSGNSFKNSLADLFNHGIDGIITTEYNNALKTLDLPVVIYGNQWPAYDCVYPDKVTYMEETVEYLHRKNHRKIAFLGIVEETRVKVLRKELAKRSLMVNENWFINCCGLAQQGEAAMRELLSFPERPDAIILHSDCLAPGVLVAAEEANVRIPEDISLISYDNLYESRYARPALTTFDQCLPLAAKMLTDSMLQRISDPQVPQRKLSFRMPLIERDSVIARGDSY